MSANTESPKVHLEDVLSKFGQFGHYQVKAILLIGFAFFNNAMHSINYIIITDYVPYRCTVDACETPGRQFEVPWYNFSAPREYRNCYKYSALENASCKPEDFILASLEPCNDWLYKNDRTFAAEFNLACQDWKRTFVGTIHSFGLMLGLFCQGLLSDKIGRKWALILSGLAGSVFGIAKSFSGSYYIYILLEFLEALIGDNCSPAFILSVELVHSDFRLHQQIYLSIIYAMGGVTMSIIAYCVPYWRYFLVTIYTPSLIYILYCFTLDESARWLLSKGKKKEAIELLQKMAKDNRVELNEKMLVNLQSEEHGSNNSPLRDTFRSRIVLKRFVICLMWWMTCTFTCFGLMVNVVSLAGNKYLNFGIMSLFDIPASFAMVYTLKRFRRKKPLFISFMGAGILCIVQSFIPKSIIWLSTGLYFIGRFVTTFTFSVVYMYTSELFPTYSRNAMHSLCSAIGRIGSVIAPMTPLLTQYMDSLPTLLIALISILAGLSTLLVPDIADDALPDNVKQAENLGLCHLNISVGDDSQISPSRNVLQK